MNELIRQDVLTSIKTEICLNKTCIHCHRMYKKTKRKRIKKRKSPIHRPDSFYINRVVIPRFQDDLLREKYFLTTLGYVNSFHGLQNATSLQIVIYLFTSYFRAVNTGKVTQV